MQLKIEINLPKDETPTPAPFDPIKIRNFVLLVIALLGIIGFGIYSTLNKESTTETISSPSNTTASKALANNSTINLNNKNTAVAENPKTSETTKTVKNVTVANKTNNIANNETASEADNLETNTINVEVAEREFVSNELPSTKNKLTSTNNITLETIPTENSLAVGESSSATSSVIASINNPLVQESNNLKENISPEIEVKTETPSTINKTPTTINNTHTIAQKKANSSTQNQASNNVINRAQLTSNMIDREPIDNIEYIKLKEQRKLYLFTEVIGKTNQTITHRWVFNQNIMAQVTLNIGSYQWRTYSSKNFDETMVGQWTVQVVDEDDNILKTVEFEVLQ